MRRNGRTGERADEREPMFLPPWQNPRQFIIAQVREESGGRKGKSDSASAWSVEHTRRRGPRRSYTKELFRDVLRPSRLPPFLFRDGVHLRPAAVCARAWPREEGRVLPLRRQTRAAGSSREPLFTNHRMPVRSPIRARWSTTDDEEEEDAPGHSVR